MTLIERLRGGHNALVDGYCPWCQEAADALEAKDREIDALMARMTQGQSIAEAAHIATMNERKRCAVALEAKDKEIDELLEEIARLQLHPNAAWRLADKDTEIERLRAALDWSGAKRDEHCAEIERLREALQLIIDDTYDEWAKTIARRALEPTP